MHGHESRQAFIFFLIFFSCTTSFTFTPLESENLRSADTKVLVVDYANINNNNNNNKFYFPSSTPIVFVILRIRFLFE